MSFNCPTINYRVSREQKLVQTMEKTLQRIFYEIAQTPPALPRYKNKHKWRYFEYICKM